MIFPLETVYRESKSVTGFFTELVQALQDEDAIQALVDLDRSKLQEGWGWLATYFEQEPGFFGFNLKLNTAIKNLLGGSHF